VCHLILFLPAFTLPIFWFLPLSSALPFYLFFLAISFFLYLKVFQAMRRRVKTGREAMLDRKALVIKDIDPEGKIEYASEIWDAAANGKRFLKGDRIIIRGFQGLSLIVEEIPFEKNIN